MSCLFAVDPGPDQSAFCVWKDGALANQGFLPNSDLLAILSMPSRENTLAVEWIEGMGQVVGKETFETCYWVGRFVQVWKGKVLRVPRRAVKLYLCGSSRAKDPNVRQALLDKVGPQGTKKAQGPTYGVKSHGWAALAVAVTAAAKLRGEPDLDAVVWNED